MLVLGDLLLHQNQFSLAPRFQNMIGVRCRLLAILQRNWCRLSLCSMACSQHSSTLSLDMAWLCGGHELKQMRCRVVVLLDWVGNEWG